MKKLIAICFLLLAGCQTNLPKAELYTDHPLVGKIWSVPWKEFVSYERFIKETAKAAYVVLGEKHDNPDHHKHQARILQDLINKGNGPAVVFEMLDWEQQSSVDQYFKSNPENAEGLGEAVNWSSSGWPSWSWYAPIANTAHANGLPIVAANLPGKWAKKIARQGIRELPHSVVRRLNFEQFELHHNWAAEVAKLFPKELKEKSRKMLIASQESTRKWLRLEEIQEELYQSHCKMVPRKHLENLVAIQRARDGAMAMAMKSAIKKHGSAVLISGSGHARKDWAVPHHLHSLQPGNPVKSLAFIEVERQTTSLEEYAKRYGGKFPFDFVWFTARLEDIDPCEKFKAQLQKMKKKT